MFERTQTTVLAVASVILAGCGDPESGSDWTTLRDTLPSGTVHVTNIPVANAFPTWTLVEELRVGSMDGAGPDAFAYLKGLVVLEDGGFAVLDSQAQELRLFDSDGTHVATHGRKGQGPGEFVDANGLMLGPNGRLWVPDARNGRVSVFDPEDGFIESFPFADGNYGWVWDGAMVDGSRIYRPWSDGNRQLIRVYDLTMTLVDSLQLPSEGPENEAVDPESQSGVFYLELDGGYSMHRIPFFAFTVSFIDSRGAVWSTRGGVPEYRITQREPGGGTTLVVETRRPAVPVPGVERDSAIDEFRQMLSDADANRELDWSRVPTVKPAVEAIFESGEGNLWVRTPSPGGGVLFDVYARDGTYLGTASWGLGLSFSEQVDPVVRGDLAWLVVTDEVDVPYVVRVQIAPAERGPS